MARLAASQHMRLVMVGGFMLQNLTYLAKVGVDIVCPENTHWPAVYGRVGGYEGSKLESHFAVIRYLQEADADYTIVHPATVCGHSETGHILEGQPLAELIRNLAQGRFKAVPGTDRHWLPVVSVDYLATMITCVAFDPSMANRQVLALDESSANLQGCSSNWQRHWCEGASAPCRDQVDQVAVDDPGLAARFAISAESLNFIQTQRFDMNRSRQLERKYRLTHPDLARTLEKTARYVTSHLSH